MSVPAPAAVRHRAGPIAERGSPRHHAAQRARRGRDRAAFGRRTSLRFARLPCVALRELVCRTAGHTARSHTPRVAKLPEDGAS